MKAKWIRFIFLELLFTIAGVYLIPVNLWFSIGFWAVLSGVLLYGTIREKDSNTAKETK